jgi:hypothetical protein
MAEFNDDEILGYIVGQHHVCRECVSDQEEAGVSQNELITSDQDGKQVFCDRCKERIL